MKHLMIIVFLAFAVVNLYSSENNGFHSFTVKDIDGNDFSFEQFKGKKVMVVNVASKCGYTKQYKELQELYSEYKDKNFVIIGFPANNFGKQEPGSDEEIKEFCTVNFGVTFPMMSKISVLGDDMHPLYQWLTVKDKNGVYDSQVRWNFQKYLIDENGNLVYVIPTQESPKSEKIVGWIIGND